MTWLCTKRALWQLASALASACSLLDITSNLIKDTSSKGKASFFTGPCKRLICIRQKYLYCLFSVPCHYFISLLSVSENAHFHFSPINIYSGMTFTDFDTLKYDAKRILHADHTNSNLQTGSWHQEYRGQKTTFSLQVRQPPQFAWCLAWRNAT